MALVATRIEAYLCHLMLLLSIYSKPIVQQCLTTGTQYLVKQTYIVSTLLKQTFTHWVVKIIVIIIITLYNFSLWKGGVAIFPGEIQKYVEQI